MTTNTTINIEVARLLSPEEMQGITDRLKNHLMSIYTESSRLFTNLNPYLLHTSGGELIKIHTDTHLRNVPKVGYVSVCKYAGYCQMNFAVSIALLERDQNDYERYLSEQSNVDEESTS